MIDVVILEKNKTIIGLQSQGHAHYDVFGKDIVCAGVSSILFGLANALDQLDEEPIVRIQKKENTFDIRVKTCNATNQLLFQMAIIQVETIMEQYQENIKIRKQEV